jgi:biotin carboxyl carrier protein
MSCKQTEVPVVPGTLLPEDGPDAGTTKVAAEHRRTRVEVRTRADTTLHAVIEGADDEWIWVRVGESRVPLKVLRHHGTIGLMLPSGRVVVPAVGPTGPLTEVVVGTQSLFVSPRRIGSVAPAMPEAQTGRVAARMAGRVVHIRVAVGDRVVKGQPLLVLEAMKMEDEVRAPRDGLVTEILVGEGNRVERDGVLVRLD